MITALVLTLNEEKHIARCLRSVEAACDDVLVVDSQSQDDTCEIASANRAEVLAHPFRNHAEQVNWGLEHLSDRAGWILRLDADEVVTPESASRLRDWVERAPADVDGLLVRRRLYFMGRRMRWGGVDPVWQLRLFRNGHGRCEQRWMDEHIEVQGRTLRTDIVIDDINLNSVSWWTAKHNDYASREAVEVLVNEAKGPASRLHTQARLKRLLKTMIYQRLPGGVRAGCYFLYRYIFRLGILDGREGLYFHLLQALWYRTLVDAKLHEIHCRVRDRNEDVATAIGVVTGLSVEPSPDARR